MSDDYDIYNIDSDTSSIDTKYHESVKRKTIWICAAVAVTVIAIFISLFWSNKDFSILDVLGGFFSFSTDSTIGRFIWSIDMPVIVAAIIVGAGLSLSGLVMQSVLRNPLASPYTLGISGAAAFGAAFSVIYFNSGLIFTTGSLAKYCTPVCAFVFSMIATGLIILLTKLTRVSPETMVLGGIAISAIFSAGLTMMQYLADPAQLSTIVSWTFGNLVYTSWSWDSILFVVLLVVALYFVYNRWNLNTIEIGDDSAKGLGLNTERFIIVSLVLTSLLTAFLVSKFGIIAFVGLLGPHIARLMIGNDHRFLIPMSILVGMALMVIANMFALNMTAPMVLPVGLLTSLLGGPTFVYLLIRRYRS